MFDSKNECERQIGTPKWDSCCGSYPTRYPYASTGNRLIIIRIGRDPFYYI